MTTTAETSDLKTATAALAALEAEAAGLPAMLRHAALAHDEAAVLRLTTRGTMLPALTDAARETVARATVADLAQRLVAVNARLVAAGEEARAARAVVEEAQAALAAAQSRYHPLADELRGLSYERDGLERALAAAREELAASTGEPVAGESGDDDDGDDEEEDLRPFTLGADGTVSHVKVVRTRKGRK